MLSRKTITVGSLFIIICTLAVYFPALRAGFIWDDPDYVVENPTLRDAGGLVDIWFRPSTLPQWYPLVHTTFWIEYHLWGLAPFGYHLVNVLLHIASSLLLWRLLTKLEVPGAWLAAAIFAVHPVEVESVAWVTERKNVLSCTLALLSLLIYLDWADREESESWGSYALALVLFIAALLSKTVVATLPATILVIHWWKRGRLKWTDVVPLIPFFIVGIAMGVFTAYLEVYKVGASSEHIIELQLSWMQRILIAGRATCFYAGKLVYPWPLVFIYPQWKSIDPADWRQWIFPVGVVAVLLLLVLSRKRIGRGPAAAAMIFCGTLFPALGFLNVYPMRFSYVADHFQYHASIAVIALIGALLCRYTRKYGRVVLVPLALITAAQTPIYSDAETLWTETLARNPNSWMVHLNLAHVLREKADSTNNPIIREESERNYLEALDCAILYDTESNAGFVYARRGEWQQAMDHFQAALRLNPNYAPAQFGIGRVNEEQGKLNEAVEQYRIAVGMNPRSASYRYTLGTCLIKQRQFPEAVANLREAVRIRRDWPEAWTALGGAELLAGHPEDAVGSFQQALQLNPGLRPAQIGLQQAQSVLTRMQR